MQDTNTHNDSSDENKRRDRTYKFCENHCDPFAKELFLNSDTTLIEDLNFFVNVVSNMFVSGASSMILSSSFTAKSFYSKVFPLLVSQMEEKLDEVLNDAEVKEKKAALHNENERQKKDK